MLSALRDLLCSKQCLHNRPGPTNDARASRVNDQMSRYSPIMVISGSRDFAGRAHMAQARARGWLCCNFVSRLQIRARGWLRTGEAVIRSLSTRWLQRYNIYAGWINNYYHDPQELQLEITLTKI